MKTILKTVLPLGKLNRNASRDTAHGPRNCQANLTFELREDDKGRLEFSASGEVWNNRKTDVFWARQCVGELSALFPENAKAQALCGIWKRWHLNGLKAGTPAQMSEIKRREEMARKKHPACVYPDGDLNWYALAKAEGIAGESAGYYDLACLWLNQAGIYTAPHNGVPYTYGTGWLHEEIPAGVIAQIKQLAA